KVADEAVHKELGDRLVKAVTTSSTLKVDKDSDEAVHKELGDRLVKAVTTSSTLKADKDSESSGNEESLGEDASKQGRRIDAIDADEDITLVSVQDDADKEVFDVDVLGGEEIFVAGPNEN
nr:hypothetical protein [Tanacetum cinerariifolium]